MGSAGIAPAFTDIWVKGGEDVARLQQRDFAGRERGRSREEEEGQEAPLETGMDANLRMRKEPKANLLGRYSDNSPDSRRGGGSSNGILPEWGTWGGLH